jgi:hypothetical protein
LSMSCLVSVDVRALAGPDFHLSTSYTMSKTGIVLALYNCRKNFYYQDAFLRNDSNCH